MPTPEKRRYRKLAHCARGALFLTKGGPCWRLGSGGRKNQGRSFHRPAQEKTWRRRGSGSRCGLENRGADPNIQYMREIDSPFCFAPPSGIIHHKSSEIDPALLDAVRSLNGCEHIRRGVRIVPRKHTRETKAVQRDISSIQRPLPFHRTNQILAANPVSGQCESGGCVSANSAIQERHGASKLGKVHTIEAALKFIRRIGQELRVERAGNFSSKKISLSCSNPDHPSSKFRFAIELFDMHRWHVNRAGAE